MVEVDQTCVTMSGIVWTKPKTKVKVRTRDQIEKLHVRGGRQEGELVRGILKQQVKHVSSKKCMSAESKACQQQVKHVSSK